jgi:hypothetical protein
MSHKSVATLKGTAIFQKYLGYVSASSGRVEWLESIRIAVLHDSVEADKVHSKVSL